MPVNQALKALLFGKRGSNGAVGRQVLCDPGWDSEGWVRERAEDPGPREGASPGILSVLCRELLWDAAFSQEPLNG